jgi:tetratricopeptide (TPR) repeat protein
MNNTQTLENKAMTREKFNQIAAVLIAVVTLLTAIVAYLQSDASARDDRANRDSKRYSIEAFGRKVSGNAKVNYDYNKAYQAWYEFDLLAASAENREDKAAEARYTQLRDQAASLSPLMAPPYFDPQQDSEPDLAKYEADTYLVEITALNENFVAASHVKDEWDAKANTYIVHLTLLAVSLFLFGLAATISGPMTRWIFSGTGLAVAVVAVIWAGAIFFTPVDDLRESGAIDHYAQGVGLAYQNLNEEAILSFNDSVATAPKYGAAFKARADAKSALADLGGAVTDYEMARSVGEKSPGTAGDLAWTYYLLGRFDDAVEMNRIALESGPDELWIQYDLALAHLSAGRIDEAKAEYMKGMASAAKQVADAKAEGKEPPSFLWWGLDDAALSLDSLMLIQAGGEGLPTADKIANPDSVKPAAEELLVQLKSLAVGLEYTGKPPEGTLTATISPFVFAMPVYDEQGELVETQVGESFEFGINEVSVEFDYAGMKDGEEVLYKVFIDGEEDPSWRVISPWDLGESGSAEKMLSLAYSDNFVLSPGEYQVEMYVNSQLAQRGLFVVLPE